MSWTKQTYYNELACDRRVDLNTQQKARAKVFLCFNDRARCSCSSHTFLMVVLVCLFLEVFVFITRFEPNRSVFRRESIFYLRRMFVMNWKKKRFVVVVYLFWNFTLSPLSVSIYFTTKQDERCGSRSSCSCRIHKDSYSLYDKEIEDKDFHWFLFNIDLHHLNFLIIPSPELQSDFFATLLANFQPACLMNL